MEFLNDLQDKIWTAVFSFFYPVTDCMPFIILMVTGFFAVLFFILRSKLLHKTHIIGLLELPILLSIHYATEQLPRLHSRIQLAEHYGRDYFTICRLCKRVSGSLEGSSTFQ